MIDKLNDENSKLANFRNNILQTLESETIMNSKRSVIPSLTNLNSMIAKSSKQIYPNNNYNTVEGRRNFTSHDNSMINSGENKNSVLNSPERENLDDLLSSLNRMNFITPKVHQNNQRSHKVSPMYSPNENNVRNTREEQEFGQSKNIEEKINNLKLRLQKNTKSVNEEKSRMTSLREQNMKQEISFEENKYNLPLQRIGKQLENKSDQYILSNKFFSDSKMALSNEKYSELIEIINNLNKNNISEDEAIIAVERVLDKHPKLIRDFNRIFPHLNNK
jgi:hypothetical protein